ncbi:unnamed protein product [Vicia faba]|uniref:CW-type domain-containing protein n=2 Tax=Vicia faba TaxID=3906 RepID=A0AAV1B6E0_VICFA|nr:unnamed protein product [Vicia faba]
MIPILTDGGFSGCGTSESNGYVECIDYQGESPDEQALVSAASAYGYTLFERTSGHIVIDINGEKLRLDVLGLHEFDSVRKRMSVVIRFPDNVVKVFVKGADTSMFSVLENVCAPLWLPLEVYLMLNLRSGKADKLQEGVPEAIESLRQAGIKVWVLTDDKQETAISIGLSCKLLSADMQQIVINGTSEEECRNLLGDAIAKYAVRCSSRGHQNLKHKTNAEHGALDIPNCSKSMSLPKWNLGKEEGADTPLALVIDGNSLVYILEKERESELFDLAISCKVVLCCRVAPLQKAGIVDLIKSRTDDMTLAIGDGANDVSMIQMADVGVGIYGQEGRQAVMASDFVMGQFQFLKRLLLVHGHWNYQRVGYLFLYNFYRNVVFVLMLFCMAAPQLIAEDWVACDRCQKWRLLPTGLKPEQLPEKWLCVMLNWLPGMNSCDFSEDETTKALYASYQVSISEGQNNLQTHASETAFGVSSADASQFGLNHKKSNSNVLLYQGKKKPVFKEKIMSGKLNAQVSGKNRNLNQHSTDSKPMKMKHPSRSNNTIEERHVSEEREKQTSEGTRKYIKLKRKTDADQTSSGTPKKSKTEHVPYVDKQLNPGTGLGKVVPKQEAVIQFVIDAIQAEAFNPNTLFLIGSYTIGKERLFLEVARSLRKKVYVTTAKLRLLNCLEFTEEDMQWFTSNEHESNIHVAPMWTLASFKRLKHISSQYASRFSLIVAFSPTGWTFGKGKKKSPGRRWQQGTVIRYEVPYSEHSSFTELKEFVNFVSPNNITPSVNNDGPESAEAMVSLMST